MRGSAFGWVGSPFVGFEPRVGIRVVEFRDRVVLLEERSRPLGVALRSGHYDPNATRVGDPREHTRSVVSLDLRLDPGSDEPGAGHICFDPRRVAPNANANGHVLRSIPESAPDPSIVGLISRGSGPLRERPDCGSRRLPLDSLVRLFTSAEVREQPRARCSCASAAGWVNSAVSAPGAART